MGGAGGDDKARWGLGVGWGVAGGRVEGGRGKAAVSRACWAVGVNPRRGEGRREEAAEATTTWLGLGSGLGSGSGLGLGLGLGLGSG